MTSKEYSKNIRDIRRTACEGYLRFRRQLQTRGNTRVFEASDSPYPARRSPDLKVPCTLHRPSGKRALHAHALLAAARVPDLPETSLALLPQPSGTCSRPR